MKQDVWAVWQQPDDRLALIILIIAVVSALYFEYKYFAEQQKNKYLQWVLMYISKPVIAPFMPISTAQNSKDDSPTSVPKVIVSASATKPTIRTRVALIIFSVVFIKRIINRLKRLVNQKGKIPVAGKKILIYNEPHIRVSVIPNYVYAEQRL